ncbi:hypothetical protein CCR75_003582 [Bremia lactucae]|uniref:Succinate dehydrogenase assembly factor 3 n=1 Tax=Bremia lactucae TaxID=4779 RepID=A0A976IE64_BRELC|nr:hypothetical protein CCR75_003579 [Bremia lactucae]TDH68599.1 hypothetical protein CCR75_003582 [Bremia lactucae]
MTQSAKVLTLYRRILTLHRKKLKPHMRVLGDQYVRDEFKRHKSSDPKYVALFIREWEQYAAVMATKQNRFGEMLSSEDNELLDGEQKKKLRSLQEAARKLGKNIGSS